MPMPHDTETVEARALFILLEARDSIGDLFDAWSEIEEVKGDEGWAPVVADAYRAVDNAIARLGGPRIQAIDDLTNSVLAEVPPAFDGTGQEIAAAIFRHCARVVDR